MECCGVLLISLCFGNMLVEALDDSPATKYIGYAIHPLLLMRENKTLLCVEFFIYTDQN